MGLKRLSTFVILNGIISRKTYSEVRMNNYDSLDRLLSLIKEPVIGERDGKIVLMNHGAAALLHADIGSDIKDLLPDYLVSLGEDSPATMGKVGRLYCAVTTATVDGVKLYVLSDHSEDEFGVGSSVAAAAYRDALMGYRTGLDELKDFADEYEECEVTLSRLAKSYYQLFRVMYNSETIRLLEAGSAYFEPTTLNLTEICGNLAISSRLFTGKRGIELTFLCADGIIMAKADRALIEVMTMCLIANAMYHTKNGGRIDIKLERDGDCAELTVADSGTALPPELTALPTAEGGRLPTFDELAGLGGNFRLAELIAERHDGEANIVFDPRRGTAATARLRLFNPGRERFLGAGHNYSFDGMDVLFLELSCLLELDDYDITLLD